MVELQKLTVKNFLSIGKDPITINFDEHERTIVSGSNGAGKSTLFLESICYALYGKSFRNLKKNQLVNTINDKNSVVELTFTKNGINFKVIRGQKPGIFEIYKNGEMIDQSASLAEYQTVLDQIIGIELNTFKQIVAIGTAGYLPFMQLPSGKRRAMIEDLIGIDVFSIVNDFNNSYLRELKTDIKTTDIAIEGKKEQYRLHKKYQDEQQSNIEHQIKENQDKIAHNNTIISELEASNSSKESEINGLLPIADALSDLTTNINKHKQELVALKSEKTFTMDKKKLLDEHDSCPTCEQGISVELKEVQYPVIKQSIDDIMSRAQVLSDTIKELNAEKLKAIAAQTDIDTLNSDIALQCQTIENCIANNKALNELIEDAAIPKQDMSEQLKNTALQLKELIDVKSAAVDEQFNRNIIKNMIGDTGVKKFIIAQYIPLLNGYISHYLEALGANYVFLLDEEFNETIKSRGRDTFSYNSFSQGERGRIDLSIILAFRKLVEARSNNDAIMNLLILDEILDSSLDADGTDDVNNLLKEISKENGGTKLFVISHNPNNALSGVWTDAIDLKKHGNFTTITKNKL